MNLGELNILLELARKKLIIDGKYSWSNGSNTYFKELKKELKEVEIELKSQKKVFLEDELGDLLWDYFNLLINLEKEKKIDLENIFKRVNKKYSQRISSIENKINWTEIKNKQKKELKEEQEKIENL